MADLDVYSNPLITRYASPEMCELWSDRRKFSTWRRLWLWLAESERELGLDITEQQIAEMRRGVDDVDQASAARYERELRHDVMAHVHAFGDACPAARPIIHLGATSCFVTDNADLMAIRDSLRMTAGRLAQAILALGDFAAQHSNLACLAFTHFQPAQPTTVGKRATLWAFDLALDLAEVERLIQDLAARGAKGTTGTQASFLELFGGDHAKVKRLDQMVAQRMGFERSLPVTGQTYTRKIDSRLLDVLSGIAQSAHKMATDWRLLAHRKEIEEPFEAQQIGSSAMAYKRNPMRSERVCGLARFVFSLQSSAVQTAATQWMERTLDDSANRRLVIPQAFLAIDAILILLKNVIGGFVVYPQVIAQQLAAELPFMASENILMAAVAQGGDRQALHEAIRQHSQAAAAEVKLHGRANDLIERLRQDPRFRGIDWERVLRSENFVGRAPRQVAEFISEWIEPIRARYRDQVVAESQVTV
jgi:adenylosuccinate lyase